MFIKITNAMIFKVLFEPNNILNLQWISADVLKNNSLCKKNVGFFKFFNVQSGFIKNTLCFICWIGYQDPASLS